MREPATRIELEGVVGRYGAQHGVGPVSGIVTGPGLTWVTGGNGFGKTTLLRLLAGLKAPAEGRISWHAGTDRLAARDLRGRIGFLTPDMRLYDELSARENLVFVARCRGVRDPGAASDEALADAGLSERAGERPSAFSSGQRQRLRLSASWIGSPEFLFLDEPSSNLDEAGSRWLWERVRRATRTAVCVVATSRRDEADEGAPCVDLGGGAA